MNYLPRWVLEKAAPEKQKRAKPKKIKWLWYKPPNFKADAKMTKDEIRHMDSAYRLQFGNERGGQKLERSGKYKRDWVIAEYNVKDDLV